MEASMDEDAILSMMRALLEAQENGLANAHGMEPLDGNYAHANHSGYGEGYNAWEPTGEHVFNRSYTYQEAAYAQEHNSGYDAGYNSWEPTSNHGFDTSSTYHEGPLDGYYAPAHQSEYDAGCHSWEPPCDNGVEGSSVYQRGLYAQAHQGGYEEGYQSWQPAGSHSYAPSSDYQGVHYAQEHQGGSDEGSHSWDMQYDNGETNCSSPFPISEDTYNMMKTLLEEQTKTIELINSIDFRLPSIPPSLSAAATEPVESFTTNLTTCNEEDDSDYLSIHETEPTEIPPIDMGYGFEDFAPLTDDFLHEAELTVAEFEEIAPQTDEFQEEADWATIESDFLLGYGGAGNLDLSYEDPVAHVVCEPDSLDGLVVECTKAACERSIIIHAPPRMAVIHMPPISKLENTPRHIEAASMAVPDFPSPKRHTFAHPICSLPTTAAPHGHPWTLPYEEIRMKEFGGWFYDEYDPGDPPVCRVHLDMSQA